MAFSANIFGPNTGISMASRKEGATDKIANKGRRGDQYLVHASPFTRSLLKAMGGAGTINPETGLMEFAPLNLSSLGGVNPAASESDWTAVARDAGYIADEDYISGLDTVDDGIGVSNLVSGLYSSIGRSDSIDKEGAAYWTNMTNDLMNEGQTYQEAFGNVTEAFVNSASLIDEQRDTLINNINDGKYDGFFADIGRDKNEFVTNAQNVNSEFGTIDALGSKYGEAIKANNFTADTHGLGDVGQFVIDSGDESIIAGDQTGYLGDLSGMINQEFGQLVDATAAGDYEIMLRRAAMPKQSF